MIDYPKKAALGASSQGIAAFPGPQYDKIVEIIDALNNGSGSGLPYGNDVGVADAYQVAIPNATLTAGYTFEVNIGNNNTGASTLQVNALGLYPIVDQDYNPISANDLIADSIYLFAFNTHLGGSYQLLGLAKPLNNAFVNNGNSFGGLATLGTLDNFDLAFITNNTEWMRVTNTGNVGIGTNAPLGKLGVVGTTRGGEKLISLYSSDWATPGEEERFYLTQGAFYARANTYDFHAAGGGDATFTIYGKANGTIKIWSDAVGSDTFSVIGGNMPTISSLASGLMFTDASWTFGNSVTPPTAKVHIIGATSDNTTYALKVENSSSPIFSVRNDGYTNISSTIESQGSGTRIFEVQSTTGGTRTGLLAEVGFSNILEFRTGGVEKARVYVSPSSEFLISTKVFQVNDYSNFKRFNINASGDILIGDPANIYAQTARLHVLGSDATAANYGFKVSDNVNNTLFSVRNDGLVGIGTNSPTEKLTIENGNIKGINAGGFMILSDNDNNFISLNDSGVGTTKVEGFLDVVIQNVWSFNTAIKPSIISLEKIDGGAGAIAGVINIKVDRSGISGSAIKLGSADGTPQRSIFIDVDNNFSGFNYNTPSAVVHIKGKTILAADTAFAIIDNAITPLFSIQNSGLIKAPGLQVGNAGLASGDLYVDTAANILANGDLVVGRKV